MSYSIYSGGSSVSSSASTVTTSLLSSEASEAPAAKKWMYAAQWSAAFCDSIEERFTCGEERWEEEFDDDATNEITLIEEAPNDEGKMKLEKKKRSKKVEKKVKSQSLFAEYHNSKSTNKKEESEEKKENEILNQFVQGNHRGWGQRSNPDQQNKKGVAEDILMSDGSTFDDTLDGETCDDSFDRTLDYTSTYDSTIDGTYDSAYTNDEVESYENHGHVHKSLPKSSGSTMKIVGCDSRTSYSSASSNDASRNDTARQSVRETKQNVDLDRDLPYDCQLHEQQQQHQPLKAKYGRSFETQPTVYSDGSSQNSTVAKSSFVTPQKMLSTYQSSSKTSQPSESKSKVKSNVNRKFEKETSKKIALGRRRATSRMIKEQAESKPKTFPYLVNHSLFHQTLDNKKARAMGRGRTGQ